MFGRAVLFFVLAALPALADDEKPLDLAKVVAQQADREKEEVEFLTLNRANRVAVQEFREKQQKERQNLKGRKVEGIAEVNSVGFGYVLLVMPDDQVAPRTAKARQGSKGRSALAPVSPQAKRFSANAADPKDPLLANLKAGQKVKVEGALDFTRNGILSLRDCTFSLPKD